MAPARKPFPDRKYATCADFFDSYMQECRHALESVDRVQLTSAAKLLRDAMARDATIFCCGNGGSAAIANHLQCDHQKGLHAEGIYRNKVVSLCSNVALVTAVANDLDYSEVFSYPLEIHGRSGDVLITVSSSGDSENIVRALRKADSMAISSIALTGFDGGRCRLLATVNVHVDSRNYGVVEDVHQSCMHALAQFIRQAALSEIAILEKRF